MTVIEARDKPGEGASKAAADENKQEGKGKKREPAKEESLETSVEKSGAVHHLGHDIV